MFNSGRLLFSHFPLLSPKCSPICNTQDRTNFCPSKNCCHCCYLHESYQVSDKLNYYFLLLLLLFLAEKYLTQLWTKAKRIYSPFSLFATCSGIVRMINSTVQFLDSKHFNSFFNCLWKHCHVYISSSPGTQVLGKIITLSSLSSSSSSSSNMSSSTYRQKQKSFSCS